MIQHSVQIKRNLRGFPNNGIKPFYIDPTKQTYRIQRRIQTTKRNPTGIKQGIFFEPAARVQGARVP